MKLDPQKTGLVLGSFAGVMHLAWSLLVAVGLAQWWMDWVLSLHFLNNPYTVKSFDVGTAVILIIVAGVAGFAAGWVFATVWNYWQKK